MKTLKSILAILFISLFLVQCSYFQNTETEISEEISPDEICQWRGPNRNGIYPETNLLTQWPEKGPEVIWEFNELGMGYSSAAVTKNGVFTAGTIDSISYIYRFDHEGNLVWKTQLGPEWTKTFPGMRSTPLIYGDKGYIINGLGKLFCFETKTGNISWQKDILKECNASNIQHGINENLLIDGDKIYCTPGGPDTNIVALNRKTGDLRWASKGSGEKSAYCSPLLIEVGGTKFLITMTFKSLVSVNAKNGEVAWTKTLEGDEYGIHAQTPYYRDGYLFVQDGYEIGCFMLKLSEDGYSYEEIWKNKILDETNGHSVVIGDNIFGAAETKKQFVCLDWNTGEIKYNTREISEGTVIAADGMLYCCTYPGQLSLVKPTEKNFDIVSSIKLPGEGNEHIAHPVIKDGRLYIRHINSLRVYSITRS
ncbi:MAG: PQQ-binding-like beta-propeller repeat protein [Bacteroidetes bacterium]|nr:PQQ-binding-like beta-propeller repeat protein [Bacteroidota bacterium]MBL7105049.1 PQQ-binding-like beta-propeller repeat protein [Bacteroidales bacterium]